MTPTHAAPAEQAGGVCCPRCRSVEFSPNHLPNRRFAEAAATAWRERRAGSRAAAARIVLGWALIAAANATRDPWSCDHCRWSFR